jgi:succinyl-diaminopimelate desuccinylase
MTRARRATERFACWRKESVDVIELTKELIRIRSENPPGNQKPIADFVESTMKEIGLSVERYDYGENKPNVIGRLAGKNDRPSLMMNAHLDTVPAAATDEWRFDPFEPVEHEGKLYGRGAADMKGGLAAMICAAKDLTEADFDLKGSLLLACVVDEEVTGFGTRDIIEKGCVADYGIVGEPTDLKVQIAHKGAIHFKVSTVGKAAHSSLPQLGLNAIYKMAKVCLSVEDMTNEFRKTSHPLVGNPTIVVTTIRGGKNESFVPDSCEIDINRRLIPGETLEQAKRQLRELLRKLMAEDPSLKIASEVTVECEPSEIGAKERIVKEARKSVAIVTGRNPGITGFPATCDMRFMVNQGKIPTIILGPGNLAQAHSLNEYVETDQIVDAQKIYALVAKQLLS